MAKKAIHELNQKMRCKFVITAKVWEDTNFGWRKAHERLEMVVNRHFEKCSVCRTQEVTVLCS